MKKTRYYIFALALASVVLMGACGCEKKTPQEDLTPTEQPDLSLVTASVPVTNDWVWSGKPEITIHVENPNAASVKVDAEIRITTDTKTDYTHFKDFISCERYEKNC